MRVVWVMQNAGVTVCGKQLLPEDTIAQVSQGVNSLFAPISDF